MQSVFACADSLRTFLIRKQINKSFFKFHFTSFANEKKLWFAFYSFTDLHSDLFFFVCDSRISIKKYSKKLFHDFIQINHIHTKNTKHITYNKTIRHQYFRFIDFRSNSAFSLSSIIFPSGLPHSQEIFLSSTLNFIFQSRFSILFAQ